MKFKKQSGLASIQIYFFCAFILGCAGSPAVQSAPAETHVVTQVTIQAAPPTNQEGQSAPDFHLQTETPTFGKLLNTGSENYIKASCTYLSLSGEIVARYPGNQCEVYPDDFHVVGDKDVLYGEDKANHQTWQLKPFYSHHELKTSEINDDLLTINSIYIQEKGQKQLRTDQIVVLSKNGKIIKSFSFHDYFKKTRFAKKSFNNNWSTDGFQDISYEKTHFNSFSELYIEKDGKKILTGYVAHCIFLKKIFILDSNLKSILQVIDMKGRLAHDVKQYHPGELIYFLNYDEQDKSRLRSRIEVYNMKTGRFTKLYENRSFRKYFSACGSVQVLPENKIFIFYSSCQPFQNKKIEKSYFEIVDLTSAKSEVLSVGDWPWRQSAYLVPSYPKSN